MGITYGKLEGNNIIYPEIITYAKDVEVDVEVEKEIEVDGKVEKVKEIIKQMKPMDFETSDCQLFLNEDPTIATAQGWVDVSTIVLPPKPNIPHQLTVDEKLAQQQDLIDFLLKKTGAVPPETKGAIK